MYRDFSENSRQELHRIVKDVESGKLCDFTDWNSDRWCDYNTLMDRMNAKVHINNINDYHKKVICKNEDMSKTIDKVFEKVHKTDVSNSKKIRLTKLKLLTYKNYIDRLNDIISPKTNHFNIEYMRTSTKDDLKTISKLKWYDELLKTKEELFIDVIDNDKKFLDFFSKFISNIVLKNEKVKNDKAQNDSWEGVANNINLSSGIISYLKSLYDFYNKDYEDTGDMVVGGLKFTSASTSMFKNFYSFLEKTFRDHPIKAARFGNATQGKVGTISMIGYDAGFIADLISNVKIVQSEESDGNDKFVAVMNEIYSMVDFYAKTIKNELSKKTLTRPNIDGKYKFKYGISDANSEKIKAISEKTGVIKVIISSIVGAAEKYKEITQDGSFSAGDIGEVGASLSVHGLVSLISAYNEFTEMVSGFVNLPQISDELTEKVINFAGTDGSQYALTHKKSREYLESEFITKVYEYADNEENFLLFRVGADAFVGLGMIGSLVIDLISDSFELANEHYKGPQTQPINRIEDISTVQWNYYYQ